MVLGGKYDDGVKLFALQQSLNLVIIFVMQVEPFKALEAFALQFLLPHHFCLLFHNLHILFPFFHLFTLCPYLFFNHQRLD